MSKTIKTKVLVVGGGPGGYVAAIRAGQLGLETTLVEEDRVGGTCLLRGCIPSKALIHAAGKFHELSHASNIGIRLEGAASFDLGQAVKWKDGITARLNSGVAGLLAKAKVKTVKGRAVFSDAKTCAVDSADGPVAIQAEHVVLATGSLPVELKILPFGGDILSSTEALSLPEVPRRLAVVGAGYIGLELGIAFAKLGSQVTVVEAQERILPLYDAELSRPVERWLKKNGVTVHLKSKVTGSSGKGAKLALNYEDAAGKAAQIPCDKILVTVGRRANTQGWGLEQMGVDMNGPFVKIDNQCRTAMKNVWAIGDLTGEPMLAHRASAQGELVAEIIAGRKRVFEPAAIPAVCFTEPEIVSVGLSPEQAKAAGHGVKVGSFPYAASGRAMSMEAAGEGGFVRVVARADNHLVLGIQAVGAHVSELSGEFAHALEMQARLEDIAGTIHAHPTLSEAAMEAAMAALGHAIHI
ncbi:MAG TPA: dihydrolipoyl dehydrogenase [Nevskia sp.]|nr:dihydrolipoyl dehydrogenase [Nevskia sp.]